MIKNDTKYQTIIEKMNAMDISTNKNMVGLLRRITVNDIILYEKFINNKQNLCVYREESHLGQNLCALLFSVVTPLLFTEDQMVDYFLSILKNHYGTEDNWTKPKKMMFFKKITGYIHEHHKKRNFTIATYYDTAYEIFTQKHYYPISFINDTVLLIDENRPLTSARSKFFSIYGVLHSRDSFLVFLEKFILDVVGIPKFEKYLDTMIEMFIKELNHVSIYTISTDRLLNYIFGYHWSFALHMSQHQYSPNRSVASHLRIHKIILEKIFPHVIADYPTPKQRNFVYDKLGFSKDKIKYYEDISKRIDRNEPAHYELSLPDNYHEIVLPNGTSFSNLFVSVDEIFEKFKHYRIPVSKREFFKVFIESYDDRVIIKDVKYCLKTPGMGVILKYYVDSKIIALKKHFYETNNLDQILENDLWTIYFPFKENYKHATIDFTPLPTSFIKKEMKIFVKHYFFQNKSNQTGGVYNALIDFIVYLNAKFGVTKSADIKNDHMLMLYHYLEVKKGWKPISIRNRNNDFNAYFNHLISLDYIGKPKSNPLINISLPNAHSHSQKTKSIPDDILVFLDEHIHELRKRDVSLMYLLLMETGWRFGDMIALTANCSLPDEKNKEIANIWVSSPKTKKHRIKNRLGDMLEDVISISTYEIMQEYIKATFPIREKYGVTTLFFTITNGVISKYQVSTFNKAINKLCESYGIKSIDETYWNTSTRQTRKTVATTLISSGASLSAVQKKLGHVTSQTTELIYAEVQSKKIAELNTEFYKSKFQILMDDEKLRNFTEEERKYLYIDFHLNRRDVELGVCTKHPSEGRCSLLGFTSCAECPKICTGKKYLDKWIALANSSKKLLDEFEETYSMNNISFDDYKNFIEYSQEKRMMDRYTAVIQAIECSMMEGM